MTCNIIGSILMYSLIYGVANGYSAKGVLYQYTVTQLVLLVPCFITVTLIGRR